MSRLPRVHGFRRLRPARQPIAVAAFLALAGLTCGNPETGTPTDETPSAVPAEVRGTSPTFEDVSARSGIEYVAIAGDAVKNHLLETTGTGIAVGDYDADGDLDLAVATAQTTSDWLAGRRPRANALFRNDGERFVDVAAEAGVDLRAWSHGMYFADVDGDQDLDLFVTAWGPNVLFRNDGDGTFTDVTRHAGVAGAADAWSSSAAFGDLDRDGDLDLYVANYCLYDLANPPLGGRKVPWKGLEVYAGPIGFVGQKDRLYRNDGNGTFTDVTDRSGVGGVADHYGLGVVFSDLDDDGDLDIFVANDSRANFLWRNDGDLRFEEIAAVAGVATNEDAKEQAGMGADAADYDRDGRIDLVVTNFSHDWDTLHRNLGRATFVDTTFQSGLRDTYLDLAWGVQFGDLDNDGFQDLWIANGHIYPEVDAHPHLKTSYRQADRLYRNDGDGTFTDVTAAAGSALSEPDGTRGLVFVDLDRDGRLDVVTSRLDDSPEILRNTTTSDGAWASIRLADDGGNRHGIGARLTVKTDRAVHVREINPYGSYLTTGEAVAHFGLGPASTIDLLTIRWPDGAREEIQDVPIRHFVTVTRGRGVTDVTEPSR